MITLLAAAAAVSAMTLTAVPSSAAGSEPVRSGTITGWGPTWVAMFNGEARDCEWTEWRRGVPGNPECVAWLKSNCDPKLAGRDPAVTASIVDIAGLAGNSRRRVFEWNAIGYPGWGIGGGVVLQFWRNDCSEILSSKWRSAAWYGPSSWDNRTSTTFTIPAAARWMTVTTNDTADLTWTLR